MLGMQVSRIVRQYEVTICETTKLFKLLFVIKTTELFNEKPVYTYGLNSAHSLLMLQT